MVGHGVFVNVAQGAFLRTHTTGEVAEVVDGQWNVGGHSFADGFAVVDGFGVGQQFQVGFQSVGNSEQHVGAVGGGGFTPGVGGRVGGIECQFNVFSCRAGGLGEDFAGGGGDDIKVLAFDGGDKLAANEVVVLGLESNFCVAGAGCCVNHRESSLCA